LLVLLLLAVPGLSTAAKVNWYLPQSNPGHYLTIATKMKVAHPGPVFSKPILPWVRQTVVSLQSQMALTIEEPREPSVPQMLSTVVLLHRSPPSKSA
jgi:hypothetical protein